MVGSKRVLDCDIVDCKRLTLQRSSCSEVIMVEITVDVHCFRYAT